MDFFIILRNVIDIKTYRILYTRENDEEIIVFCQNQGQLAAGEVEIIAIRLWSSVHGFANLILEDQFPKEYLQDKNLKDLLKAAIS